MGLILNGLNAVVVAGGYMVELLEEAVPMVDLHPVAAEKDALPDAPDGTSMGLGDAAGSLLTSTATNNTAASETVMFDHRLSEKYQIGAAVTVIVRCRVSVNRDTAQTVDCTLRRWQEAGAVGGDICTTAIQNITNAYADYAFTLNPATVVPGDLLNVILTFAADDTGGGSGAGTITATQITTQTGIKQ